MTVRSDSVWSRMSPISSQSPISPLGVRRPLDFSGLKVAIGLLTAVAVVGCRSEADRWSDRDLRILRTLRLSGAGPVPDSPSNRFADNPAAAAWGKTLFFDQRLSGDGKRSCGTCHMPKRHFTDGKTTAVAVGPTRRNTPTVIGAAYHRWFYWDGRRDSLWSQALIPFEAPEEMGASRTHVVSTVARDAEHRRRYVALFGNLPSTEWLDRWPAQAGPFGHGATREAWHRLSASDRQRINQIYANIGKAIAAYERTLVPEPSPLDRYLDALADGTKAPPLTDEQRRGLALFIDDRTRCLRCHNGPMLTNRGFHNIGTGNLRGANLDFGRVFGVQAVLMDEFNCRGIYSDAQPEQCTALRFLDRAAHGHLEGAFKVPSLRGVSKTAPYFHDGRFATLEEVVRFYNAPQAKVDGVELDPIHLSDAEVADLVAFLEIL